MLAGTPSMLLALVSGFVGIGFVIWQLRNVLAFDQGNDTMRSIAAAIQQGATAFLRREYTFLAGFVVIVAVIMAWFLAPQTALCFVCGALACAAAGYLGMYTAVRADGTQYGRR